MNLNEFSKNRIINKIVVQIVDGTKLITIYNGESWTTKIDIDESVEIIGQDKRFSYMLKLFFWSFYLFIFNFLVAH